MLKKASGFADVPADQMTREQHQELPARHNGGPYWQDDGPRPTAAISTEIWMTRGVP